MNEVMWQQPDGRVCIGGPVGDGPEPFGRYLLGLLLRLVGEMEEGGIADPLSEQLTLAAVFADVCRIGGIDLPTGLAVRLEA